MSLARFNPFYVLQSRLRPGPVSKEQGRLLWLVGVALLIEAYDVSIYGLAIPQIQRSLSIAEADVGRVIAIFRLGVIPALGLAYLADVFGRRRMLMATVAGATIATISTGFAQDLTQFLVAQTLARICSYAESMLCFVIIAEEFDERTRGWAIGVIGALGAGGAGLAALMYGFVTLLPFGWRALFFLGAIPLLWLMWARRRLAETRRFAERKTAATYLAPLSNLLKAYPIRLIFMIGVTAPLAFVAAPAVILISKYLQTRHGWAPWQVTTSVLFAGPVALLGTILTGAISDRLGRRLVLSFAITVSLASLACLYTWASGAWLILFWVLVIYGDLTAGVLIGGLSAELFPTSHRSLAAGVRYLCAILAGALGLIVEGGLYERFGNHAEAITWMLLAAPVALVPIWFLPEPAAKALEVIAPEHTP